LHYATAATPPSLQTINKLLSLNANVDSAEHRFGLTPLMMAAKFGNLEVVEMLLSYGADIDCVTIDGRTALCFAAWAGNLEIVHVLLDAFKVKRRYEFHNAQLATEKTIVTSRDMMMQTYHEMHLLRYGWSKSVPFNQHIPFKHQQWYHLYFSFSPSKSDACTSNKSNGAHLSPLHLAIRDSPTAPTIIRLLIEAGADVNAGIPIQISSWSPYWYAVSNGRATINDHKSSKAPVALVESGASHPNGEWSLEPTTNTTGTKGHTLLVSPLCFAIAANNPIVARALLTERGNTRINTPPNKHCDRLWHALTSLWHSTPSCHLSTLQYIVCLFTCLSYGDMHLALTLTTRTWAGWTIVAFVVFCVVFKVCFVGMIPRVNNDLMKMVMEECHGRSGK
jgi:ankyrin repeat protein